MATTRMSTLCPSAHIRYQTCSCANKCYIFIHHHLIIAAVVWCVEQQSEVPILHFALL